jgi:hypothetical protein
MSKTSTRTNPETIKDAFALYLKYNGERFDLLEEEMHRLGWAGFKKAVLFNRGKGENARDGWIERFGWKHALKVHLANVATVAATSAESLLAENEAIRKQAFAEIQVKGVAASKDVVWQHNTYTNNCIKILDKLEAARDNYGNFAFFLTHLLRGATQISPALAKELVDAEEALIEWAEREFVSEDEKPDDE